MDRFPAMETFVRIVEAGSLSAAACKLATTQPSVSRQLRALERRLQTQLLQHSTRHASLTEAGRAYYEDCKRILADVDAAEGNLGSLRTSLHGTLKVNTSVALGVDCVAPLACAFGRQHPELAVDLTLNVAIRFGPVRDGKVVARRLATTRWLTVAAPAYLRQRGAPSRPEDLHSHACVGFNYYAPVSEWSYQGPQGEVGVKVTAAFRSNNGHVVRGAILAGLGIGWLPEVLIHRELNSGKLRALLPGYVIPPLEVHAVYSSARHMPMKVRAFLEYVEAHFTGLPGFAAAG